MSYVEVFLLALALYEIRGFLPRVVDGEGDCDSRYPFVGAFIARRVRTYKNIRTCTGSIIAPEWVITAGHCLNPTVINDLYFAYGDLSQAFYKGNAKKVLRGVTSFFDLSGTGPRNDIGLVMIEAVKLEAYGKLSSLDAKSLIGYAVEYAGAGGTYSESVFANKKLYKKALLRDQSRPLQIGQAVIAKCNHHQNTPAVCLRPKCDNKKQHPQRGDSGGPLFYSGKIIAIASSAEVQGYLDVIGSQYTPLSPYLDWIKNTISVK